MPRLVVMSFVIVALGSASPILPAASAQEPGWSSVVIARGERQARIQATPILERYYRPFHFYGNTVRRRYYRSRTLPTAGDFLRTIGALLFRRR